TRFVDDLTTKPRATRSSACAEVCRAPAAAVLVVGQTHMARARNAVPTGRSSPRRWGQRPGGVVGLADGAVVVGGHLEYGCAVRAGQQIGAVVTALLVVDALDGNRGGDLEPRAGADVVV